MKDDIKINVTKEEQNLLQLIRDIKFGELRVIIQNSKPIRVEKIVTSIKL